MPRFPQIKLESNNTESNAEAAVSAARRDDIPVNDLDAHLPYDARLSLALCALLYARGIIREELQRQRTNDVQIDEDVEMTCAPATPPPLIPITSHESPAPQLIPESPQSPDPEEPIIIYISDEEGPLDTTKRALEELEKKSVNGPSC